MINKYISLTICQVFLILGFVCFSYTANSTYLFGFFNGVFTTERKAIDTTTEIERLRKTGENILANETVQYHSFYNTSGSEIDGINFPESIRIVI